MSESLTRLWEIDAPGIVQCVASMLGAIVFGAMAVFTRKEN